MFKFGAKVQRERSKQNCGDSVNSYENTLNDLRSRLNELRAQNASLEQELSAYRRNENEINAALRAATDKAKQIEFDVKVQYALEIERLKLFQAKWTNAYEELKERYHFGKDALNLESVAMNAKLELEKMLSDEFSLQYRSSGSDAEQQFHSEIQRLGHDDADMTKLLTALKLELQKIDVCDTKIHGYCDETDNFGKVLNSQGSQTAKTTIGNGAQGGDKKRRADNVDKNSDNGIETDDSGAVRVSAAATETDEYCGLLSQLSVPTDCSKETLRALCEAVGLKGTQHK